jgi:hypothetical protein
MIHDWWRSLCRGPLLDFVQERIMRLRNPSKLEMTKDARNVCKLLFRWAGFQVDACLADKHA